MTTSDLNLLSVVKINENLGKISGWNLSDNGKSITKNFKFENFKKAISFVNYVAEIAEQEQHHPDLRIYNYNNLEIKFTTHSADGLTQKDFDVASRIDEMNVVED